VMNSEKETPYELCPIHYTHVCVSGVCVCVCVCVCVGVRVAQYTDYARGCTIGVRIPTEETVFSLLQSIQISCATTQLVLGVKRPEREVDH
jgi:hypothetical protein